MVNGVIGTILCLAFGGWVIYLIWPARVSFKGGTIIKRHRFKTEKIPLADLAEIQFHYHAAVGFCCVWEFTTKSGKSTLVSHNDINDRLVSNLERCVPNFSREHFYQMFKDGDIEDTLHVWHAA